MNEFEYADINGLEWRGKPSHTMIWKRSIAIKHNYLIDKMAKIWIG